ncbi:MAG: hypothetical protein GWO22_24560 [Actinobacteria bacterium]|nr:hypothetical protein [Actinomycetota bacterium]
MAFTREHRTTDAPFDVAVGGSHIEAPETSVEAYRRAGATWWVESIGFPGRTTSEWLDYVAEGPPDT